MVVESKIIAFHNTKVFFTILISFLIFGSCSTRMGEPKILDDATIQYPANNPDQISGIITLFKKLDKKNNILIGEGTEFTIKQGANIRAFIEFNNRINLADDATMFHLDWIGPNGRSVYRKCIDLNPGDSSQTLNTSISISPEKRVPGKYTFRVYYFRELIAEKHFEILPEFQPTQAMFDAMDVNFTLYRAKSKKSGKLLGEGSEFTRKAKRNVRAIIEIENSFDYGKQEVFLQLNWVNSTGESVYRKNIDFASNDTLKTIKSSISISPEKRPAGAYALQILLFDRVIASTEFVLE